MNAKFQLVCVVDFGSHPFGPDLQKTRRSHTTEKHAKNSVTSHPAHDYNVYSPIFLRWNLNHFYYNGALFVYQYFFNFRMESQKASERSCLMRTRWRSSSPQTITRDMQRSIRKEDSFRNLEEVFRIAIDYRVGIDACIWAREYGRFKSTVPLVNFYWPLSFDL